MAKWLIAGTDVMDVYPCTCDREDRDPPEFLRNELGADTVIPRCRPWVVSKGAAVGTLTNRCDCWGQQPHADTPPGCCRKMPGNPALCHPWDIVTGWPVWRGPQGVCVRLSASQVALARMQGVNRERESRRDGAYQARSEVRELGKQLNDEMIGNCVEFALAFHLGLDDGHIAPTGTYDRYPDVGMAYGARGCPNTQRSWSLLARDNDPGGQPLVFGVVDMQPDDTAVVDLKGWVPAGEAFAPRWLRNESGRRIYGKVPWQMLRPLDTLPSPVDGLRRPPRHEFPADFEPRLIDAVYSDGGAVEMPSVPPPVVSTDPMVMPPVAALDDPAPVGRRWSASELHCPCPTPWDTPAGAKPIRSAGVHCTQCHRHWMNPGAASMHQRRVTDPCRDPRTIVDVDTGKALMAVRIIGDHQVWGLNYGE